MRGYPRIFETYVALDLIQTIVAKPSIPPPSFVETALKAANENYGDKEDIQVCDLNHCE